MHRRRSFTLIELLLVVGVIAILAAIVIIAVNPTEQLRKAQDAKRDHGANQLEKAIAQYQIAKGKLPNDAEILTGTGSAKQVCAPGVLSTPPKAARFTAANGEHLSVPDNVDLSMGDIDFTIFGWVYLNVETQQGLLSKADNINNDYLLYYQEGASYRRAYFRVWNGAATTEVGGAVFGAGGWHFIVAWHDAANDTLNVRIDDAPTNSASHSAGVGDTASPFTIGKYGGSSNNFLNGRMAQWGVIKRTLTNAEMQWLYNDGIGRTYGETGIAGTGGEKLRDKLAAWWALNEASGTRSDAHGSNDLSDLNGVGQTDGFGPYDTSCVNVDVVAPTYVASIPRDPTEGCANYSGYRIFHDGPAVRVIPAHKGKRSSEARSTLHCGLVGYWTLDESSGLTVSDASGQGNHGTIAGSPVSSTSVPPVMQFSDPYSLSFNGTTDYVEMGMPVSLQPPEQISFGGWVNWTEFAQDSAGHAMMSYAQYPTFGYMMYHGTLAPHNYLQFFVVTTMGAKGFSDPTLLTTNAWHHVFVTYDGAEIRAYIDGVLTGYNLATGTLQWVGTTNNFFLGTTYDTSGEKFHGLLDDMRVYNRALSEAEVASLAQGKR